jgi:hypothetical protein
MEAMTKDEYLELVRQHAEQAGGTIGLRAFCRATRMPERHFLEFGFDNWGAAVAAANLRPVSFFRPRADDADVVRQFVQLAARLGRWPTENDIVLARKKDDQFPCLQVVRRLGRSGGLAAKVVAFCEGNSDLGAVAALAARRIAANGEEPSQSRRAHVEGYVYMMRSGRRYKIGYTSSPSRRHREVRLDLPDPTDLVHTIPTDDPPGIEAYWHHRFRDKRVRDTEFFELDAADVLAFKARKYQ